MTERSRIYLAGPDVFLPDPIEAGRRKLRLCEEYGFEGVYPLDAELDLEGLSKVDAGLRISHANEELIRSCQLVVANLTPFRGPSLDVGTSFEIGFARALELRIYGYTNVPGNFAERTHAILGESVSVDAAGERRDAHGMSLEDFDLIDNLMVDGAILASGGEIVTVDDVPESERYTDLRGFEECLGLARVSGTMPRR